MESKTPEQDEAPSITKATESSTTPNHGQALPRTDDDEGGGTLTEEALDKHVARSMKNRFREVTDTAFQGPAEIVEGRFEDDYLMLSIRLPFWLVEPSRYSRWQIADQDAIRWGYLKQVFKSRRTAKALSNLFFRELVDFLIAYDTPKKKAEGIVALLKKIPERRLAGRPRTHIDGRLARRIQIQGSRVHTAVLDLQARIRKLREKGTRIDESGILRWFARKYPTATFPWLRSLPELTQKLPRARYLKAGDEGYEPTEDVNGNLSRPTLVNPDTWSAFRLTPKVIQTALLKEAGIPYPLQEIKHLLHRKSRKSPSK